MMRAGIAPVVLCGLVVGSACTTAHQGVPPVEQRIAGVVTGLHVRRSRAAQIPSERWTLEERMTRHRVPAVSIAVIHGDTIHWSQAYGTTVALDGRSVTAQTPFQAASISKALTAFATLLVVDRGLLSLDTPVNRYLRSWTLPASAAGSNDSVTIALTLGHMAGLSSFPFPGYAPGTALPTLAQILDGVPPALTPPVRITQRPGSTWTYSNGGYLVLQQVLEDVTSRAFSTLMDSLVLAPLGMEHSTFQQPLPARQEAVAAVGHDQEGVPLPDRWRIQPELAAAGLWTTASDLARFALAVRTAGRQSADALLAAPTAVALTTPRFTNFSLGLLIRRNGGHAWFTLNGGNEGYRCLMYVYLTAGVGAVVMTNADAGLALASEIINSIALEYRWPSFIPEEFW